MSPFLRCKLPSIYILWDFCWICSTEIQFSGDLRDNQFWTYISGLIREREPGRNCLMLDDGGGDGQSVKVPRSVPDSRDGEPKIGHYHFHLY